MPRRVVKVYPPSEECLLCKGNCCKRLPGPYHPSDFPKPITVGYLLELLKSKKVVIDWWEKRGSPGYFLRPLSSRDNSDFFQGSWGASCVLLTPKGCPLSFKDRPLGCRALKPRMDSKGTCTTEYGKFEAFRSWLRYRKVIEAIEELTIGSNTQT